MTSLGLDFWQRPQVQLIAAGTALFCSGFALRSFLGEPDRAGIIPSPHRTLLPKLSEREIGKLSYPPDAYPGGRWVETPFGTQRVFEFGPKDGRKALCVHGISTPCVAMGGLAHALADKGCRVILFDLPGRGWSDTPADLDHDIRLFMSAILIVLASSPVSWTGPEESGGFDIIGYSLGGGISAAFTSYFPDLIRTLVLIAPSGLIREYHLSTVNKLVYARTALFEPVALWFCGRRLRKPLAKPASVDMNADQDELGVEDAMKAELGAAGNKSAVLSRSHPHVSIEGAVNTQIDVHEGYVRSVLSSLRYAPILRQHEKWRKIGQHLVDTGKDALLILGDKDPIINMEETKQDVSEVFRGHVEVAILEGTGHETGVARGSDCAEYIWNFWGEE